MAFGGMSCVQLFQPPLTRAIHWFDNRFTAVNSIPL